MARKLKTYVTTSGFYDLAVAAPSMKAALAIWGSKNNLFQNGFAEETSDRNIVKATMAKPGIVLRRGVGTKDVFSENAELPQLAVLQKGLKKRPAEPKRSNVEKAAPRKKPEADTAAKRKAAQLYDLAEKRREREESRAAAAEEKENERRERAVGNARAALDAAQESHDGRLAEITKEREALDRRARKEIERWDAEKERLEGALGRARE